MTGTRSSGAKATRIAKAKSSTKTAKAKSSTKIAKASTATHHASAKAQHTKVASATPRNTARSSTTGSSSTGAKSSSSKGDNTYQSKLRHCAQQPTEQREACLDQVIEQTQRS